MAKTGMIEKKVRIKTEQSVAEDLRATLLKIEATKLGVLTELTKPGFLEYGVLAGEELKERFELVADAIDNMVEPINVQAKKIGDALLYIEKKKALLRNVKKKLSDELQKIFKIKGFLVDKDITKIHTGLAELKTLVSDCRELITEL